MFNSEFYPTPEHVIQLMVGTIDLNRKHVLEPSAGKGDIVDFCAGAGAFVTACEKNSDLAKIVATKCKFMKHDFLEVTSEEVSHIDYIIMNPPFSNADAHIMHAWEIAPHGCEIVALCNYETISNKFTRLRSKLGSVIRDYGQATNIGDVFTQAERTTGIDIGLIHLFKPADTNTFEGFFDESEDETEQQYNGIMPHNSVREAVQRYVAACQLFNEVAENAVQMNYLVGSFGVDKLAFALKQDEKDASIDSFKKDLQKRAWLWVFSQMNMDKFLTKSLKEEINRFVEKQQNVPFTMKNIYRLLEMVVGTHQQRMERVLVEVFDKLTKHHAENRYNVEGWKTNSHYMVNQKFILEGVADSDWGRGPQIRYAGRNTELMEDFIKALNFITGAKESTNFYGCIRDAENNRRDDVQWGQWFDFTYFTIRLYKKGTMHAKFKDKAVWERFNRAVAKAKGFPLPENVKL
jgi:hypothetical protein